ncbi:hypothetical protein H4R19_000960 [Coemansia spiralis]|nr:hypothetical protein H4R19_000960 [Coemansia spiralis]
MQYQYVVSAYKAGSVSASVRGAFTAPGAVNLIVAKGNRVQVHVHEGGERLRLVGECALNGTIATLHFMHPAERPTGLVVVTSDKFQFAVLAWDAEEQRVATESSGEFAEVTGRATTEAKLAAIDPHARLVAVYAYQGIVHLLPMVGADGGRWRTLARACCGGESAHHRAAVGSLEEPKAEPWPYAAHGRISGGLLLPAYLQAAGGAGASKGKAPAFAERSSDIYPVLTRYIRELKVLDLQFLQSGGADDLPAIAVLNEDANMQRQVHVYQIGERHGELHPVSAWTSASLDATASKLVPLPGGAVLALSDESLAVVSQSSKLLSMSKRAAAVAAWEWIDDGCGRLLLADEDGVLSLVVLRYTGDGAERRVEDLFVERLGDIPVATSLSYLADGCVYVGSHCSDQALVRLHTRPLPGDPAAATDDRQLRARYGLLAAPLGGAGAGSAAAANTLVEALASYPNLAPLVDLCVVGTGEAHGHAGSQPQSLGTDSAARAGGGSYGSVVACSGMRTTPGLRVVRNGIGIARALSVDIRGLLGLWSMTVATPGGDGAMMDVDAGDAPRQVLLVLGLTDRTLLLGWQEPAGDHVVGVDEVRPPGWRLDEQTLAAATTRGGRFAVQVTPARVVLLDAAAWDVCGEWTPADAGLACISAASVAGDQVVVAADGSTVVYLELRDGALVCVSCRQLASAVSCVDVHSWLGDAGPASHVAVGLWEANDVCLLSLPDLSQATPELSVGMPQGVLPRTAGASPGEGSTGGPPRSVLMCTLGGTPYLLAGLGDGQLHQFALQQGPEDGAALAVREHKCIALGAGPLMLAPFDNGGAPSVFAAGDHSAVLFADRHRATSEADSLRAAKLIYANVDVRGIQRMAPIASAGFPAALCLGVGDQLWVGCADPVQQLHVRSWPLPQWAAPHRIAHCAARAVYGVATIHALDAGGVPEPAAGDAASWERLALMDTNEQQARLIGDVRAQLVMTPPVEAGRFSVLAGQEMTVLASLLLRPYEMPESLAVMRLDCLPRPQTDPAPADPLSAGSSDGGDVRGALDDAFVLGTSVVLPGEDDAKRGRILVGRWDAALEQLQIVGSLAVMGAVYALVPFRGMLLAAVGNRLLLLGWQRRAVDARAATLPRRVCDGVVYAENPDYELVVVCSQQAQVTCLSLTVAGDYVAVGDIMSSVSMYRYEESRVALPRDGGSNRQLQQQQQPIATQIRRRLVPVARDYSGVWTTAVATVPPPLAQNLARLRTEPVASETGFLEPEQADGVGAFRDPAQERLLVADAYGNLIRMARGDEERLYVEGRWHLGDMANVIRAGSLVMDIPDPEFPGLFRPQLVYGTLHGAIGVVASVEDGKLGRVLGRLQTNMAHLLPTAGLWDYDQWRGYASDQRSTGAFGFLDGDLIEQFLDLPPAMQQLLFSGGGALVDRARVADAEGARKREFWASYARVEAEGDVEVLAQMAVSDIAAREGVTLDFVVRLVESLARLH